MTGLETGERLQRALEKEGESVTLAKKSRYLPDPISVSTSQCAGEQFRAGKEGVIFIGACGSQCAVSHTFTLPEKRRIRLCW